MMKSKQEYVLRVNRGEQPFKKENAAWQKKQHTKNTCCN